MTNPTVTAGAPQAPAAGPSNKHYTLNFRKDVRP